MKGITEMRLDMYYTTEGYGLEYWDEDGLHTVATGLAGSATALLTAKKWLKDRGITEATINGAFGAIWEIKGSACKMYAPCN